MAITILDDLPEFLKNFLIRRGIKPPVDPNAVPVSSGLVPALTRRRVVPENAYTSGDIDVDPPADIQFDPSYFSNLLGGLFGNREYPELDKPFPEVQPFGGYGLNPSSDPNSATKDFIAKTQNDLISEKDRSGRTFVDRLKGGFDYLSNPYLSNTQKSIATLGKMVPSLMGGLAAPAVGLFGAIGQAMGAHHPLNFNKDSNVFMDPVSGTSIWDSLSDGGGGAQVGVLNLDNQIASAANNPESQGQYVETPYGYITIGDLNNAIKSGLFDSDTIAGMGAVGSPGTGIMVDAGFTDSTPVSFQSFDGGTTTGNAINQYEQLGIGPIWNQAGAVADALNLGYNQMGAIAEDIKNTTVDNQSIYGFDFDYGNIDSSLEGIGDEYSDVGFFEDYYDEDVV